MTVNSEHSYLHTAESSHALQKDQNIRSKILHPCVIFDCDVV